MAASGEPKIVKKLVLCFDGTGNTFAGNNGDTNIVKIYHKLDRENDDNQYHYYQPGIGTYDVNSASVNKGLFGSVSSYISQSLDSGFGTSFDAHVIAGYRFIMRYYDSGDKIYLFGFSRGAFTARFLSRMINKVGILSKGNEEMVPFAYQLYQKYEKGQMEHVHDDENSVERAEEAEESQPNSPNLTDRFGDIPDEIQAVRDHITAFKHTFCRRNKFDPSKPRSEHNEHDIKVHFLGIFDCVSSVAVLENPFGGTPKPVKVSGTAHHVRHAVAVDEHRVKFKAALLDQDLVNPNKPEDGKEVWFPGNHGDVGGGWPVLDAPKSWWEKVSRVLFGHQLPANSKSSKKGPAPYQMSDIPLAWMIRELEDVEKLEEVEANRLHWNPQKDAFLSHFNVKAIMDREALEANRHDTLRLGKGTGLIKVLFWNFLECLPLIPRWELEHGKWVRRKVLPNLRGTRDMPTSAVLHKALLWRLQNKTHYKPSNNHGGRQSPCLDKKNPTELIVFEETHDPNHTLYTFQGAPVVEKRPIQKAAKAVEHAIQKVPEIAKHWSTEQEIRSTEAVSSKAVATIAVAPVAVPVAAA